LDSYIILMEKILNDNQIIIAFFHLFQDAEAKKNRHFYNLDNNSINTKDFKDKLEIEINIEPLVCVKHTKKSLLKFQGKITRKKDTFISLGNFDKFDCSSFFPNEDYKFSIKLKNTNNSNNKKNTFSSKKIISGIDLFKLHKISLFNIGKNLYCEIYGKEELDNYQIQINNQKINDNIPDSSKFSELLKETEKVISIIELIFSKDFLLLDPKDFLGT